VRPAVAERVGQIERPEAAAGEIDRLAGRELKSNSSVEAPRIVPIPVPLTAPLKPDETRILTPVAAVVLEAFFPPRPLLTRI
jgi:hypothetical protein